MNNYVVRINLKTLPNGTYDDQRKLMDFCLNSPEQCLAIGWNHTHYGNEFHSYSEFFNATVKNEKERNPGWKVNFALNAFRNAQADDLFWTRDMDGNYWICRAKEVAKPFFDEEKNIGAIIPVEAYNAGMEVPGEIKRSVEKPLGGIAQRIYPRDSILEYSKSVFNKLSGKDYYTIKRVESDILDNLPAADLEELAILYLQIKHNYCVLSNSIANKSTTIKIECELISRSVEDKKKAVVQVKSGNSAWLNALDYKDYADDGYFVYLYAPHVQNAGEVQNAVVITKDELRSFYNEYKEILPDSITMWETLVGE